MQSPRPAPTVRALIVSISALVMAWFSSGPALAQADRYPSKTGRLIVGQSPGGATDIVARLTA